MAEKLFPKEIKCPGCRAPLILEDDERIRGEFTCPECDEEIILSSYPETITITAEGLGDEVLKGIHAAKSYVGSAFLTLLFYYIGFYIVGLICNFVFLSQANESRRIADSSPSGRGCLVLLIWIHLIIPAVILLILFSVGAFASM